MDGITARFVKKVKADFDKGIVNQKALNTLNGRNYDVSDFYPYLDSENGFVSRAAVNLIAKSGHAMYLMKCFENEDEDFRVYVSSIMLQNLPLHVSDQEAELFMPYLEDKNETVRENIVWMIRKLGRIEMLTHLLFDPDMKVVKRVQRWIQDSEKEND